MRLFQVSLAIFSICFAISSYAAPKVEPHPAASVTPDNSADLQSTARVAVSSSLSELGTLETWQKRIFVEEVVPHYQRFVRDYRSGPTGAQVAVDLDGIKKYLAFFGPTILKRPEPKVAVLLKTDPACDKCKENASAVQELYREYLARRGLSPIWVDAGETGSADLEEGALRDRLSEIAKQKNAAGWVLLLTSLAPSDTIDSAHADENHYLMKAVIELQGSAAVPSTSLLAFKSEGKLDLIDNDDFSSSAGRLWTDAMTSFGAKALSATAVGNAPDDEMMLVLAGFHDFDQYSRAKAKLFAVLQDQAGMEELSISRGEATFGLQTKKTPEQLRLVLSDVKLDPGTFVVTEAAARTIKVEIR